MRKGLGVGLFGAFLAALVAPQMAKADPQIPTDGLAEGSGHWVTARYDLSCKGENRLFVDATVHTRIVDGMGKDDCKGERLEISNRASKPFHYGINGSVIATVASGGVVTIFVPRPSDPEADTRIPLTGRHFSDCGVGKMWKNGTCRDWEDPCPAGESRADIVDLWQAQGEDYSLSAIQWRIGNECYDDKGKFDSDDAECKAEVKRCEDQRSKISSNQHDHSTVHDAALSDMRRPYLGQTYTIRDQKIFDETDAAISCGYTSRETIFKRSKDRQAIGERHWRVANEYSNWLIWKQQVNRECSIKNNQAPKQIATFTPRKYQEPTFGPGSGRKHGTTNPTPDTTRSNGQSLNKSDDKDKEDRERRRHTFEHHNDGPPLKAQPLEQNNKNTNPPTQSQSQPLQKTDPTRPQPPTTTNTPPRDGGHEQHQNAPKLPGQPLDQNLGRTGPQANAPLTPNGPNGTRPVPLGVQANPTNPTNPSTSTPSRTNPPTIADLGKKLEEERREREQREQAQRQSQLQGRERADADRQRLERERHEREQREQRDRLNQQSQQNDRMRADRERADRERADRERNERASREADQRRDEQRRQLEQQQRQAQEDRRRQQQEESRRQQQEEARRQRDEERRRQAQEESRRQQEEQRRQSQQRMQPSTSFGRRR